MESSFALLVEISASSTVVAASVVASVVIALVESELASVVDCEVASVVDTSVVVSVDTSVVVSLEAVLVSLEAAVVSLEAAVVVLSSVVISVESVPDDSNNSVVVKMVTSSGSSDALVPSEPIASELLSTVVAGDPSVSLVTLANVDTWSVEALLSSAIEDSLESVASSTAASVNDVDSLAELDESVTLRIKLKFI